MKYFAMGLALMMSAGVFFACSGTVEDASDGEEKSSADVCGDYCAEIAPCYADSGSGLSSIQLTRQCREECLDMSADASRNGCRAQYDDAVECSTKYLSCGARYGSGDDQCDREIERYYRCRYRSSGSGSGYYSGEGS